MIIDRLVIRNFRSHGHTFYEFSTGVTAIVGDNEAGKSTVFEAIAYALFGHEAVRGKMRTIRPHFATADNHTSVDLQFSIDGARYKVHRGLKGANLYEYWAVDPVGEVVNTWQELAQGTNPVTDHIRGLLGMNYSEFAASYLCRQGDLPRLSAMTPMQRQNFVRDMLGVGVLTKAVRLARAKLKELKEQKLSLPSDSDTDKEIMLQTLENT